MDGKQELFQTTYKLRPSLRMLPFIALIVCAIFAWLAYATLIGWQRHVFITIFTLIMQFSIVLSVFVRKIYFDVYIKNNEVAIVSAYIKNKIIYRKTIMSLSRLYVETKVACPPEGLDDDKILMFYDKKGNSGILIGELLIFLFDVDIEKLVDPRNSGDTVV